MNQAVHVPMDVKLMNATSVVLGLAFVGMLLAFLSSWLLHQNLFRLTAIKVTGDLTHNNAVTLRANVVPKLAGNFFTVDLTQTQAAFETVPWIRRALVQREFPNRLRVLLQEHQPIALWGLEGDTRLVNSYGEVFEANQGDVESDDLPLLSGPQEQAPLVVQAYRRLLPVFAAVDANLAQLELTGRGSWRAQLDDGAVIELGQGSLDDIDARAQRFVATLTQVSGKFGRKLESADLRYANGYALRLRGITTTALEDKDNKQVKR